MRSVSIKIMYLTLTIVVVFSLFSALAYAQTDKYTVLAPLPGVGNNAAKTTTLTDYLPAIFKLSIGIAAVLAFVMITFGGITYMTTDAIGGKSRGREYITNALWGLLLVIGAWVILNTINPQILSFDLFLKKPDIAAPVDTVVAGITMTPEELAADQLVRGSLGSGIIAAGPCEAGQTINCVNLNGLQPSVVSGLKALATACGCTVSITGGTEGGHSTGSCHNPARGNCVDLHSTTALSTAIANGTQLIPCGPYTPATGGNFLWEPAGQTCGGDVTSSADHWHVVF